jgi:uncharacterized protein
MPYFRTDSDEPRLDGTLENAMMGLGGDLDMSTFTDVGTVRRLNKWQHEELYRDWLCCRICNAYPMESMRAGWETTLGGEDQDQEKTAKYLQDLAKYCRKLNLRDAFIQGGIWANIYGGAGVILIIEDGRSPDEPVNMKGIRTIRSLTTLDRHKVYPEVTAFHDASNPEHYRLIFSRTVMNRLKELLKSDRVGLIHKSRLLRFDGVPLPPDLLERNNGWGDSMIDNVWSAYSRYEATNTGAAQMVATYNVFVLTLKNLAKMRGTQGEADLNQRFRQIMKMMSIFHGLAIDSDEKADFISRNFSGVGDILDRFRDAIVGAAAVPHTILFGESPSGLGATGESEEKTWATFVGQYQENVLRPKLEHLFKLIWLAKDGPTKGEEPDDWGIKFKSLFQQSETEMLSNRNSQSQIDSTYLSSEILLPEEIRQSRFGGAAYSYETTLDDELWLKKQDEAQQQQDQGFGGFGGDFGGEAEQAEQPPADEEADQEEAGIGQDGFEDFLKQDTFRTDTVFADKALHEQATREAKAKFKVWPSAYASMWLTQRYRELQKEKRKPSKSATNGHR